MCTGKIGRNQAPVDDSCRIDGLAGQISRRDTPVGKITALPSTHAGARTLRANRETRGHPAVLR